MPILTTKTFRITEAQAIKLSLENRRTCGELMRSLLEIYWNSPTPGIDVIKLRKVLKNGG